SATTSRGPSGRSARTAARAAHPGGAARAGTTSRGTGRRGPVAALRAIELLDAVGASRPAGVGRGEVHRADGRAKATRAARGGRDRPGGEAADAADRRARAAGRPAARDAERRGAAPSPVRPL